MAFENDKGPLFLGIFATGSAIAILITGLRFWVRARIVRKLGADDWIMLSSLVSPHLLVYQTKTVKNRVEVPSNGRDSDRAQWADSSILI